MFPPALPPARLGLLALGLAASLIGPPRAAASTVIVPDDSSTVSAAIASGADTVLVRAGTYAESPVLVASFRPIVLMADPDASPRPTLQGLIVKANHSYEGDRKVVGLRILNTVDIQTGSVSARYDFEACRLEAGVRHLLGRPDYDHAGRWTTFLHCTLRGDTYLFVNSLTMESDTVEAGSASFSSSGGGVWVLDSWFRGPAGLYVTNTSPLYAAVVGNRFEDCAVGIDVNDDFGDSGITIENNMVRSSQGLGIRVRGEYVDILRNDVRDGGGGIDARIQGGSHFIGNTVIRCAGAGITVSEDSPGPVEVRDNLVLRCGGGIAYVGEDNAEHFFTGNTSALNAGAGLSIAINASYDIPTCVVSNNVAYSNTGWGLNWTRPAPPTLGCNDWFANTAGPVFGTTPGATDLSVDPLFCDISLDDAHPRSDSPLVGGPCGQIGALGVGCGETPTLVQRFTAGRVSDGVRVVWQVAPGATASEIWVERAEGGDGQAWTRPAMERSTGGGSVVELDRTALPDHAYRYRLVALDGGQVLVLEPGVLVPAAARLAFRLAEVGPSPGGGLLRIGFSLARDAEIEIAVYDLLGRRVATVARGAWPAGTQAVEWDGRIGGEAAPAGLYVLRYSYPGGSNGRAIVRVR